VQGFDALRPDRRGFLKMAGVAAGAVAVGGVVAGCSSDSDDSGNKQSGDGKLSGSITIYTAANVDVMKLMTDQFEKNTGVSAKVYRDSSGIVAQRFLKEQQANQKVCDVLDIGDLQFMEDMGSRGYLQDISGYPGVSDIPDDWKDLPYVVTENQQAQTVAYNTDLVKGDLIPKEWPDLLKPDFKGKIAIADPRNNVNTTGAFLMAIVSKYGWEYMEALGKQDIQFTPSSPPAVAKVASGDAMLAMPTLAQNVVTYAQKSAPVLITKPLSPTTANSRSLAIPKNAPNAAAAKAWVGFVLSVAGQSAMNVYKDVSIGVSPLGTTKVPGSVEAFPEGMIYTPGSDEAQKNINKLSAALNIH
jgi:iron(III) transport system substrate-binding protein